MKTWRSFIDTHGSISLFKDLRNLLFVSREMLVVKRYLYRLEANRSESPWISYKSMVILHSYDRETNGLLRFSQHHVRATDKQSCGQSFDI